MLQSISWDIFFKAAFLFSTGYYVVSTLLLFHIEIVRWLKSRFQPTADSQSILRQPGPKESNILGSVGSLETAETKASGSIDSIVVGGVDEKPEEIHALPAYGDKQLLVGSVADLLEEVKTLVQLISEYKSTKAESAEFFSSLFIRYPHVKETSFREAIILYLCEAARNQFVFDLTVEDIAGWWTTDRPISNTNE